jgi:hypothetical protein
MNDSLVMFLIQGKEIAIRALRGFGRAYPSFIKDYLNLTKVGATGPSFEYTLTNVHEEIYPSTHYEIDVVGMIALLINIFSILYFQGLKKWNNIRNE